MNPQTNKLFAQALDQAVPETWATLTPEQLAKFAEKFSELLVRECAGIALTENYDPCECILKHFGVDQ